MSAIEQLRAAREEVIRADERATMLRTPIQEALRRKAWNAWHEAVARFWGERR
jgi:hypothetical protein